MHLMPGLRLLVGMSNSQQCRFVERLSEELQPNRHIVGKATWQGNSWNTSHVCGNREDVRKIHLIRIFHAITDAKCSGGGCRCDDDIDVLEGAIEILLDERTHLLSFHVIGVVIP